MLFEKASELKEKGNEAYRQKNYIAAFQTYSSALHILNGKDTSPAWIQLQFDLHSNQVQTCIKMSKYDGQEHMDMNKFALRHKDNMDKNKMSKALYRCGRFFESVKDPVKASGTYQTSLDYDPGNLEAQAALKRVNVTLLGLQDPALQYAADHGLFKKGTADVLSVTGECSICSEQMYLEDPCLLLNCSHSFHQTCIVTWHATCYSSWEDTEHFTCPICRKLLE
jgi:tetratricopeptide (TPR) repeat protein